MDNSKIGQLIRGLRKEQRLTQQQLAQKMHISNKTVSKWECGLGCPDISLWADLSALLNVDIGQMIQGEMVINRPDSGNLRHLRFYVCPSCQNILFSTGNATLICCGRGLTPLHADKSICLPDMTVQTTDEGYFVSIAHEMTRAHFLLFAAYIHSDKLFFTRLYPEQNAELHLPYYRGGTLCLYCTKHGLSRQTIK